MTTAEVVPAFIERGKVALKKGAALTEIAEEVLDPAQSVVVTNEVIPFPPVPKPVEITDKQKKALRRLKDVFAVVQPTERRALKDEELAALYEEREVLKVILDLLDGREEDIKTLVRTHMDVIAEETGVAVPKAVVEPQTGKVIVEPSPRDQHGHYVLCVKGTPERCDIPGTDQAWSREFRSAGTTIDGNRLAELYDAEEITREEYLGFTREVRVFDGDKAKKFIEQNPVKGLSLLRRITTRSGVGSSLFVRKAR